MKEIYKVHFRGIYKVYFYEIKFTFVNKFYISQINIQYSFSVYVYVCVYV